MAHYAIGHAESAQGDDGEGAQVERLTEGGAVLQQVDGAAADENANQEAEHGEPDAPDTSLTAHGATA
ncbi:MULTISPECIES: hypothetical protein [unclassified Kitasatospora]|uniref:hypothetical protein n=1 Tax=unclassified Kitasatospora TaxID=2633591 RepID=UPI0033FD3561